MAFKPRRPFTLFGEDGRPFRIIHTAKELTVGHVIGVPNRRLRKT